MADNNSIFELGNKIGVKSPFNDWVKEEQIFREQRDKQLSGRYKHYKTPISVRINSVRAFTSEPSDNYKREVKEKQTKYIKVDFEILNQNATSYSMYVYKGGKEIYQITYVSKTVASTNESKNSTDNYPAGKYYINWDITNNKVFNTQNKLDSITFILKVENKYKEVATIASGVNIINLIAKMEKDYYIIILGKDDKEQKIYGSEIIERQKKFMSQIPKEISSNITIKGKLILALPIIMTKLNFLHGALCQIHWLEGSTTSLKFPYNFFMSEKRVENIDKANLNEYFSELRYLSVENLSYTPSSSDGLNQFLFNDDLETVKIALEKFNENLEKRIGNGDIGGSEKFINEITEGKKIEKDKELQKKVIMENYFQAFSIGSATGDIDDLGVAIGMFRQACYFRGSLEKLPIGKWGLSINNVLCRFFDSFSFNDEETWYGGSQNLGYWKFDTKNPELPVRLMVQLPWEKAAVWLLLENVDFRELRKVLQKSISTSCNDFYLYSDTKIIDDDFIEKDIVIY